MNWLLRFWPWHEHVYSISSLKRNDNFHCRCGAQISGHELFDPDTMLGKHWRERHTVVKPAEPKRKPVSIRKSQVEQTVDGLDLGGHSMGYGYAWLRVNAGLTDWKSRLSYWVWQKREPNG